MSATAVAALTVTVGPRRPGSSTFAGRIGLVRVDRWTFAGDGRPVALDTCFFRNEDGRHRHGGERYESAKGTAAQTLASQSEMPHDVARVTPVIRTQRALRAVKLVVWTPLAEIVTSAAWLNTAPSRDVSIR
jgi:hypothetical protein